MRGGSEPVPKAGWHGVSVPDVMWEWIEELVAIGVPPYQKYQGRTKYVATIALDILERGLYALTVGLSPQDQDRIWRRARGRLARLDAYDKTNPTIVIPEDKHDDQGGSP